MDRSDTAKHTVLAVSGDKANVIDPTEEKLLPPFFLKKKADSRQRFEMDIVVCPFRGKKNCRSIVGKSGDNDW